MPAMTPSPVELRNDDLIVSVVPEVGAKVIRLFDRLSETEWLQPGAWQLARRARPGDRWEDFDRSGWDECFPNITPGRHPDPAWRTVALHDHGEVWCRPWAVEDVRPDAIVTAVAGVDVPFVLRRTLSLRGPRVQVDYELSLDGREPFACAWAMHPLLATGADLRVELAAGTPCRVDFSAAAVPAPGDIIRWPGPVGGDGSSLDRPTSRPLAVKLYADAAKAGPVTVHRGPAWLRLDVGSTTPPGHLGLWLNYGGWPQDRPDHHVGVEATTAGSDALDDAVRAGSADTLYPHEPRRWSVSFTCGHAGHDPTTPTGERP